MSFKDADGQESYKQYYLPTVKIEGYNVMIDGKNFFDQPIKSHLKTYDNIRKIVSWWLHNWMLIRVSLFLKSNTN